MTHRLALRLLVPLLALLLVALAAAILVRQFRDDEGGGSAEPPSSPAAPRANEDHWHATYEVVVCGEKQPNFSEWPGGVHTHGDGIIHIHPFRPSEEGSGARLVKWFEYGGGKLTDDEMRMPGDPREFKNGDTCPDGFEAVLQVFVNGERLDDWSQYIPQDGDRIVIVFGPELLQD